MSGRRGSTGSEGDLQLVNDERKRKRMDSNRESARRSRMKKQHHLEDLINEAELLKNQNREIELKTNLLTEHYIKVESENCILRAQKSELAERLQSLNAVLHIVEEVSGMAMDIPEIPDPLLEPWLLPCPAQPITAVADMLMF